MDPVFYEMNDHPDMCVSLWGPGQAISGYKTSVSNVSTPSTPPYSQSLELESRMLDASTIGLASPACLHTTVIASSSRPRHGAACSAPQMAIIPAGKSRGRGKTFIDPCEIAPLKKRRIQVGLLSPDEREKVLYKREKNKLAAEKCRVKRREGVQRIRLEYEEELVESERLEAEIKKLKEDRDMLQELLDNHTCVTNT